MRRARGVARAMGIRRRDDRRRRRRRSVDFGRREARLRHGRTRTARGVPRPSRDRSPRRSRGGAPALGRPHEPSTRLRRGAQRDSRVDDLRWTRRRPSSRSASPGRAPPPAADARSTRRTVGAAVPSLGRRCRTRRDFDARRPARRGGRPRPIHCGRSERERRGPRARHARSAARLRVDGDPPRAKCRRMGAGSSGALRPRRFRGRARAVGGAFACRGAGARRRA